MTIRILIAEDQTVVRQGLRELIESEGDLQVVAEAEDGPAAVALVVEHRPDLVLMDVGLPGLGGIEATRRILAEEPGVRVLALSMHADRRYVEQMLGAGAAGYLLEVCAVDELVRAVREVAAGQMFIGSGIDLAIAVEGKSQRRERTLTGREVQVLTMLADGFTTRKIAERLDISTKTVESHRASIMDKLGLRSVAELNRYAVREGLVDPADSTDE